MKRTDMKQIYLERVTWDNCDDVIKLHVKKEQKGFVASNADSLIDAFVTGRDRLVIPRRYDGSF